MTESRRRSRLPRRLIVAGVAVAACGVTYGLLVRRAGLPDRRPDSSAEPVAAVQPLKAWISYADAEVALAANSADVPPLLKGRPPAELASAWTDWVTSHDAEIRQRLRAGDEESLVNFWLYGTSFTGLPRATSATLETAKDHDANNLLLVGRLNDLVAGAASPGENERLLFARGVIARQGIDLSTPDGRERAATYLAGVQHRMNADAKRYLQEGQSARQRADPDSQLRAYADLFRRRGLSSDTSLAANFSIDRTLQAMSGQHVLAPAGVHRVAIIGPGLDFTDKAEGYDFYPQQTIQPFAVIDSLNATGLAAADLGVVTLDLSPRVNHHLDIARARARGGGPYVLQLLLDDRERWHADLIGYWQRFGATIGFEAAPLRAPPGVRDVDVRSVSVRPAVVLSIHSHDVNIVTERLEPLAPADQFDLVVATNVLVYYDRFEQALALTNIARMLRPGGCFLTNYAVSPPPSFAAAPRQTTSVFWDRQGNGDTVFVYQRQ